MKGFVQIPREIFEDDLWISEPFTKGKASVDLFQLAKYSPGILYKRGISIKLKPGQIGYSQIELGKLWGGWSEGKVGRFLDHLQDKGQIEVQKTNVSTIITLTNWVQNSNANEGANEIQMKVQTTDRTDHYYNNYNNNKDYKENKGKGNQPPFDPNIDDLQKEYPKHDVKQSLKMYLLHSQDKPKKLTGAGWQKWLLEDIETNKHPLPANQVVNEVKLWCLNCHSSILEKSKGNNPIYKSCENENCDGEILVRDYEYKNEIQHRKNQQMEL